MSSTYASIEELYQQSLQSWSAAARAFRSAAMFQWAHEQIVRQLIAEHGPLDSPSLKWLVALRMYGSESVVRELIERELRNVSG